MNCTGIMADDLRILDDAKAEPRIVGAQGTHLMFKKGILPVNSGIINPKTQDGRLLFVINYHDHPMAGTTDDKCEKTHFVKPSQAEIDFICNELKPYFGEDYDYKNNLLSSWAGIRPLVKESKEQIEISDI